MPAGKPFAPALASAVALAILLSACTAPYAPRQVNFQHPQETIPLRVLDDCFLVEVKINNHGPYLFMLDTGATATTLSNELVHTLQLPKIRTDDFSTTPFGTVSNIDRVDISTLTLAGAEFRYIHAQAPANDDLFAGRQFRGILGFATFSNLVWTFDGPGRKLILNDAGSRPATDKYLPMDSIPGMPDWPVRLSRGRAVVPMSITSPGMAHDKHLDAVLDTGCVWEFLVPASLQNQLPATSVKVTGEMQSASGSGTLHSTVLNTQFQIGEYTFNRPTTAFIPSPNGLAAVGTPILKDFVITFDMPQARVYMRRPAAQPSARVQTLSD